MSEPAHWLLEPSPLIESRGDAQLLRVLVIDDSPNDRDLFRRLLCGSNGADRFECLESEQGRAGLEQFRRGCPACVLLDLKLPDMDGLDLLRSIVGGPEAAPVIAIADRGSEERAVEAMKAGATDYIVKGSITAYGLAHVILNALEKRALERRVEQQKLAAEELKRQLESALEREREAWRAAGQSDSRYRTLAEAMPQVLWTADVVENQRRAGQLLHQRQKLESVGILAGGVAHDFNNLLVGIIGGLSYALEVLPQDHEVRPVLEGAFKSGEQAADLTRQLLAYAGKGSFQVGNVDVEQTVGATWELIRASLPRSVDLKLVIPRDLPPIHIDPAQLQQIVMNLILNASEAIPSERQGRVALRAGTERVDAPRSSWSGDLAPGDYVLLEVCDNGSGIPSSLLSRIFDPFFSTKLTGRGLGLAAVFGIVRGNKGSIEVTSTLDRGTTFRVLLPAGKSPGAAASATPPSARGDTVKGRILVVDDEPIVRSTVKSVLEHAGHEVEVASGGRQALELLAAAPGFSLVLLDLSMPDLGGKQTFEAIRNKYPGLPVVICSGYSDSEVRSRFAGSTVNGFLQKPFHSRTLSDKVARILRPD